MRYSSCVRLWSTESDLDPYVCFVIRNEGPQDCSIACAICDVCFLVGKTGVGFRRPWARSIQATTMVGDRCI